VVVAVQDATTFVIPGLRVREEPGTYDWASGQQPGTKCLTRSWVPGSRLRRAPE